MGLRKFRPSKKRGYWYTFGGAWRTDEKDVGMAIRSGWDYTYLVLGHPYMIPFKKGIWKMVEEVEVKADFPNAVPRRVARIRRGGAFK